MQLHTINSVEDARHFAATLIRQPASHIATFERQLGAIKASPDSFVVIARPNGAITIASICRIIRNEKVRNTDAKDRKLGHSGRGFYIRRSEDCQNGQAFLCHDVWTIETVPASSAASFLPFVNTIEFRESTAKEDAAWFRGEFELA